MNDTNFLPPLILKSRNGYLNGKKWLFNGIG